ncbi:MAG: hypothetical protein RBT61_10305, partial [Candidatus Kapabacteria bacterium]|nr:hypothetical protein [Candidatus Kapabacteria bacterium]
MNMNCCLTCSQSIRASEMITHLRNFVNFYFLKRGSKMAIIGVILLIFFANVIKLKSWDYSE